MREWLTRRVGKARLLRWVLNLYPPYLGAGVRIRQISADFREVQVSMGLGWYNRNYVGTQFGGSLYSMVDPFFMLDVHGEPGARLHRLGQGRSHRFHRPGQGPGVCSVQHRPGVARRGLSADCQWREVPATVAGRDS
ncbi:DUF4442 domain-containing protein [Pseudomonas protegens]|uniref:DUF4442 domain-containing protein n=1 Tax=Pseudomonas protegens TaxID=380021 RepID=UPI00383AEB39